MDNILEMRGITKSFFGVEVLHGVDFSIKPGEVIALCGENGAGKSTLMKILMGIYSMDSGEIIFEGKPLVGQNPIKSFELGLAMIHQEQSLVDQLTIAQNIFLGREPLKANGLIDYKKMNESAAKVMTLLKENTPVTTPVGQIKVAQKQLVEIARAINFDCKLIVMDEPTAVLTDRETEILFDTIRSLKEKGVAVVYISHRLAEIKLVCDKVVILRDGMFIAEKDTKSVTEHQIASLMVGRELKPEQVTPFTGDPDDVILEVRDVKDELLDNVSFKVRKGEILGFSGLVGAGRTELMEYIFGLRKVQHGTIFLDGKEVSIPSPTKALKLGLGFATEDRKATGVVGCRSISDNINYCFLIKYVKFMLKKEQLVQNSKEMIDRLRIVCSDQKQPINSLSGGNQQKVILSRWLLAKTNILILDEPTRGIDVGAREEIYQIIRKMVDEGKTVIVVSSDLPELLSICPRIIVMYEGKVMGELEGEERTEDNIMTLASGLTLTKA